MSSSPRKKITPEDYLDSENEESDSEYEIVPRNKNLRKPGSPKKETEQVELARRFSPSSSKMPPKLKSRNADEILHESDSKMDDLDSLLKEKGYKILDNIIINDTEKKVQKIGYIKAFNCAGDIIFINLNKKGNLTVSVSKKTSVTISESSEIPYSVKVSTVSNVGSFICGVMFQSKHEYCFIKKTDDGQIEEISYEIVNHKNASINESPIIYPVVNLTDIEYDNEPVLLNSRLATIRIEKNSRERLKTKLATLIECSKQLTKGLEDIQNKYSKMEDCRYAETKHELKIFDKLSSEGKDDEEVVKRLYSLSDASLHLKSFIDNFTEITLGEIKQQDMRCKDVKNSLYLTSREKFSKEISPSLYDPSYWGLPQSIATVSTEDLLNNNFSSSIGKTEEEIDALNELKRIL